MKDTNSLNRDGERNISQKVGESFGKQVPSTEDIKKAMTKPNGWEEKIEKIVWDFETKYGNCFQPFGETLDEAKKYLRQSLFQVILSAEEGATEKMLMELKAIADKQAVSFSINYEEPSNQWFATADCPGEKSLVSQSGTLGFAIEKIKDYVSALSLPDQEQLTSKK